MRPVPSVRAHLQDARDILSKRTIVDLNSSYITPLGYAIINLHNPIAYQLLCLQALTKVILGTAHFLPAMDA